MHHAGHWSTRPAGTNRQMSALEATMRVLAPWPLPPPIVTEPCINVIPRCLPVRRHVTAILNRKAPSDRRGWRVLGRIPALRAHFFVCVCIFVLEDNAVFVGWRDSGEAWFS